MIYFKLAEGYSTLWAANVCPFQHGAPSMTQAGRLCHSGSAPLCFYITGKGHAIVLFKYCVLTAGCGQWTVFNIFCSSFLNMSSFPGHQRLTLQLHWWAELNTLVDLLGPAAISREVLGESEGTLLDLCIQNFKVVLHFVWATRRTVFRKAEVIIFPKGSSRVRSKLRNVLWILRIQMVSKSCMDSPKAKYQVAIYELAGMGFF